MFQRIFEIFRPKPTGGYYLKDIYNSVITFVNRTSFEVDNDWFQNLLEISYNDEIKSKYIPELHQTSDFEIEHLTDVLNFQELKDRYINQIIRCENQINSFRKSYNDFYQIIKADGIKVKESHSLVVQINLLETKSNRIETELANIRRSFLEEAYRVLLFKNKLSNVYNPTPNSISYKRNDWSEFLDKEPVASYILDNLFHNFNYVIYEVNHINRMLDNLKSASGCKIIAGRAGTGKTHISAHMIQRIRENSDYVLFFKGRQFSGDNINLSQILLELLQIPPGYTLNEILRKLNDFTVSQNKRCFFIIDALNETTKSSIGFSTIWYNYLPEFIKLIGQFSHLYFVCTLRISYINNIWNVPPSTLIEIKGFENPKDLKALCELYFEYYKIEVTNLAIADLDVFGVPLLLDLYCKLINEDRSEKKNVTLDMNTYLQIFEDYIDRVSKEVKRKLNLRKENLIKEGFTKSSNLFFKNNNSIVSLDDFNDSFDKDDAVTEDNSISKAVLEGYLIFIKDVMKQKQEIVKHTQQEVGGYLLAKYLIGQFPSTIDLLSDIEFKEKITNVDPSKHHQLRLDILKFLIALNPAIVLNLTCSEGLDLSWWYLYNGYDNKLDPSIPGYLLSNSGNLRLESILERSSKQWFNPDNEHNFHFIARVLEKFDLWAFDMSWTFFVSKNAKFLYDLVQENIQKINEVNLDYSKLFSKFVGFVTATTTRDLRDLSTVYLIEFGKKHPLELLALTEYTSSLTDTYIYERLASCCYGVALILQNDERFVRNDLSEFARRLFQLQFAPDASQPVYNYIVIDSIKHLVDLAIYKKVFSVDKSASGSFYNFNFSFDWSSPTVQQKKLIDQSTDMSWPDPIGMDFAIYTIPRLLDDGVDRRQAIANVYKRIFELGYQVYKNSEMDDEELRDFYFGSRRFRRDGSVDRLGKKYSWKGFFDFAGFLLQEGKLKIFEKYSGKKYYQRLSDVDIDVSLPNQDYKLSVRLYDLNLMEDRETNYEWHTEVKIDSIVALFEHSFENNSHIMLYGMVEQLLNEEYNTRSYILVESFFIKKNESFERAKKVQNLTIDEWKVDNHHSPDHLSRTYFGELYWADNIAENNIGGISVPTGEKVVNKFIVDKRDVSVAGKYKRGDVGKEVEETVDERLYFDSEPTLAEYIWESESQTLKGFHAYYPSVRMGKCLGLKAEPSTSEILDSELKKCFLCIDYKEGYFKNEFNYMRSDLLRKYMIENDLAILYQVKQHSYDEDHRQKRFMKYFIFE
jgi:hypothetical protein